MAEEEGQRQHLLTQAEGSISVNVWERGNGEGSTQETGNRGNSTLFEMEVEIV